MPDRPPANVSSTTATGLKPQRLLAGLLGMLVCAASAAQGLSCSNDGRPAPTALLERFMDADCSACWSAPSAPPPAAALLLDWVLPSPRGEEAAMSAVALSEAADRLEALGPQAAPQHLSRRAASHRLRVVQGFAFNGYLGATLSYTPRSGRPYTAWMLLVEQLPAGREGSAVARQLVRAAVEIRPGTRGGRPSAIQDTRAFRVPEGANVEQLRVLAWVQDDRGRLLGLGQSHCGPG